MGLMLSPNLGSHGVDDSPQSSHGVDALPKLYILRFSNVGVFMIFTVLKR